MGLMEVTASQGIIFALVTLTASYYLPWLMVSQAPEHLQGLDTYLGETSKVKKVGEDYKVSLDGVDYLVDIWSQGWGPSRAHESQRLTLSW